MSKPKRVAVCMVTYNCADYLKDMLNSLVNQTFKDFTVYIWMDGCEDNTKEVVDSFVDKLDIKCRDARPVHNIGTIKNKVVNMALKDNPEYIQMVDSDDVLEPWFLELMVGEIERGYDFVVCNGVTFGETNELIHNEDTDKNSIIHTNPFLSWIMIKANVIKGENYRVDLAHYEDWDLHLRLILGDKAYSIVKEPLYNYRMHPNQFHKITEINDIKHRMNMWQLNNINTV